MPISTRRRRTTAAAPICIALVACFSPFTRVAPAAADPTFDQSMLELVNVARAGSGVAPLQWSTTLGSVAENGAYTGCGGTTVNGRAYDMGQRNYFSHTILGCNQSVGNMVVAAGLSASALGENIAWAKDQGADPVAAAQVLHKALMSSPDHRANILNATYTHVGVGSWRTAPGGTWTGGGAAHPNVWVAVQVFAKLPASTPPPLAVSPSTLSFSSPLNVVTQPQVLTVKNVGTVRDSITGAALSGQNPADFGIGTNTCLTAPLAPGSSCTIALVFAPKAVGSRSANLSITGDAPTSVPVSGTGTAALPGAPTDVTAIGGDGQLSVTWGPAPNGGSVSSYGVWAYDANGYADRYASVCATCTSATVTGLANGKAYYVVVAAHTPGGWGAFGWSGWVTVAQVPGAPTDIRLSSASGQLNIGWKAPANAAGAAIDGYLVALYDANGYTGTYTLACATCTSVTLTGLANGARHHVVVYAYNLRAWGAPGYSDWHAVAAPTPPQNLSSTPGNGHVAVAWTAPASDSGSRIDGYLVAAYDANGYTGRYASCAAECRSAIVTGLTNNVPYAILAYAHNVNGWGIAAVSNVVTPVGPVAIA